MRVPFVKMHGLGNDFVIIDARAQELPGIDPESAAALANRRTGIGCDQLIVLENSPKADLFMRIFNQDGSEVEACGNATRAVGLLIGRDVRIETLGGILRASPAQGSVSVAMGHPRFDWDQIPLAYAMDTLEMPVAWDELVGPAAVNVGNPHAIFFVDECDAVPLAQIGPAIEHDPLFPQRVNVNIATVADRKNIRLRVWERGVGETLACGTGACATAVAAMRRNLADGEVTIHLKGGALRIAWDTQAGISMTGPATESFRGTFDPAAFGVSLER